jgi:hypothetical protein
MMTQATMSPCEKGKQGDQGGFSERSGKFSEKRFRPLPDLLRLHSGGFFNDLLTFRGTRNHHKIATAILSGK